MPSLIVYMAGREIQRCEINKTITHVGRDPQNDLVLDNSSVSRVHARFEYVRGNIVVRDVGSRNGLMVNGKEVRELPLRYGDRIGVGKFVLELNSVGRIPEHKLIPVTIDTEVDAHDVEETFAVPITSLHSQAIVPRHGPQPVEDLDGDGSMKGLIIAIVIGALVAAGLVAALLLT